MRDNLTLAHVQTELWRAYVITRQRDRAPASAPTERRAALRPLRFLMGARRRRCTEDAAAHPE